MSGGPTTSDLLHQAQRTVEQLTEELMLVRQQNATLKKELDGKDRQIFLLKRAALDERARRSVELEFNSGDTNPDHSSSSRIENSNASMDSIQRRKKPWAPGVARRQKKGDDRQQQMSTPRGGSRTQTFESAPAVAARLLRENPVHADSSSFLSLTQRSSVSPIPHQPRGRDLDEDGEESAITTIVLTDSESPQRGEGSGSPSRPAPPRNESSSQSVVGVPAPHPRDQLELEVYVEELRSALYSMQQLSERKQGRIKKLEDEVASLLEAREGDLSKLQRLDKLLNAARASHEGATKQATQAKRETAKVQREFDAVKAVAAGTIEELAEQLRAATGISEIALSGAGAQALAGSPSGASDSVASPPPASQ